MGCVMKISVIIPAYNSATYIDECIQSVLYQTYKAHQIIVVDDGSTDCTSNVISKFKNEIEYIYQPNSGPSCARNKGVALSTGDWIAFLDSDDVWMPDKLEKQVNYMRNRSSVKLVVTDMFEGQHVDCERISTFNNFEGIMEGHIFERLLKSSYIYTPTVLVEKNVLLEFGGFNVSMNMMEDLDLFLRIAHKYEIGVLDELLVFRRRHSQNISMSFGALDRRALFWEKVLHDYPDMTDDQVRLVVKQINRSIWESGYNYFDLYLFKEARTRFIKSFAAKYKILQSMKYLILSLFPGAIIKIIRKTFGS